MCRLRLIKQFVGIETICIDATYKLNWMGYPYFVCGTVDMAKKFHPLFFACCTNEKTGDFEFIFNAISDAVLRFAGVEFAPKKMIADAADAIRNAFYKAYTSAELDIMCYPHVLRNVRKFKYNNAINKRNILRDIHIIHLAATNENFEHATNLFLRKWKKNEPEFCVYFKKEWLGDHKNWFEQAADYTPSHNNHTEGYNSVIKRLHTHRQRLPMAQFTAMILKKTHNLSIGYKENKRFMATEPKLDLTLWRKAAQFLQTLNFIELYKDENKTVYCVSTDRFRGEFTRNAIETAKKARYQTFDQFAKSYGRFWTIELVNSQEFWNTKSKCNCKDFCKNYICVHVVSFALHARLCKMPRAAYPTILEQKKKSGRKPKNGKALLMK